MRNSSGARPRAGFWRSIQLTSPIDIVGVGTFASDYIAQDDPKLGIKKNCCASTSLSAKLNHSELRVLIERHVEPSAMVGDVHAQS
jgi:hypothetical protein